MTNTELEHVAREVRKDILVATHAAKSGHPGGSLSAADILTYLYFEEMNVDPADPHKANRDRFVLSKGHVTPALYGVLAERGFFPKEELKTFRHLNTRLQGHPNMNDTPGVDMSTGSLGQGVSTAVGMALAAKKFGDTYRTYALLGDGEIEEGQVWEAAMFAAKYDLSNIIAIIDRNNIQIGGDTEEVMPLGDLADKWRSFGWDAQEIDGHDYLAIIQAIDKAKNSRQPSVIIAHTIPGFGVDFMEYDYQWHGKSPNAEEAERALAQLSEGGGE